MRRTFALELARQMSTNQDIYLISIDLGYKLWDEVRDKYSRQFINTGASEQAAADIAVGLAYEGKIPFLYTITPFYLRCFETLRTYINHEKLPVKMIGSGRDYDYKEDGPSHWATDIPAIIRTQENIVVYEPDTKEQVPQLVNEIISNNKPSFVTLRR